VEQDYRPIHVVVVNDGGESVKNVLSLYDDPLYKDELVTITLVDLVSNVGRARAANHGLDSAQGEYISFLDDDDYWLPCHLSYLVSKLMSLESCSDVALSEVAIYSATRAVIVDRDVEKEIKVYETAFDKSRLLYNNFLPIHSVLFSRSVLDKGVRFDESFDLFEDWDFWLQVSCIVPFVSLPNITCVYRLHSDASGVHAKDFAQSAYQKIYEKWLAGFTLSEVSELFRKTHGWCSEDVDTLQSVHQEKLNAIGALHTHAVSVISEKDEDIASLNETYSNAISVITEKDANIRSLEDAHCYAVSVVTQRDVSIVELRAEINTHCEQLVECKEEIKRLQLECSHSLSAIKDRDLCIAKLEAINVTQTTEIADLKIQAGTSIIKRSLLVLEQVFGRRNK
jgi:glycosyltransferase involved in cell wall biosynthesis